MNILSVFKNIGKGALAVSDIGAKANVPILSQIDAIADSVTTVKVKRKLDEKTVEDVLMALEDLRSEIPAVTSMSKKALESNRFKMVLIGVVTALAVNLGFPENIAANLSEVIFYLVSVYVLGDTFRGSVKPPPQV